MGTGAAAGLMGAPLARAQDVGSIRLGWVKSTANLMAFLAPDLSGANGLKIESINFNTAQDILTGLISGQLDVGLLTPVHLLRAIDTNVDVVQVAGNTRGNTGVIAHKSLNLGENDWNGLKELVKTKRPKVASSRGSVNELLAIAEFEQNGIDTNKDIEIVNIANFAQHPQALRSGEFDMVVTLEPLAALSVTEGTGIYFSKPYNTPAGDLNTNYVVPRGLIGEGNARIAAFVKTLADARDKLADDAFEVETAKRLTGLDENVLKVALDNCRYELSNSAAETKVLAEMTHSLNYTTRNVAAEVDKHIDDQFINAIGVK
jgi:ABC-type nitrate/sulfonate/bicarbonate transport system substrate-binding protein